MPFDKDWTGFSAEEYREASESVMQEEQENNAEVMNRLNLSGYEVVRAQYFSTLQNPAMTISNGKLRFNTSCLKKFEDVEYVELLLNSVDRCVAIRPCEKGNPNAIHWGRLKEGRWCASTLGCRGLAKTLFDIMEWEEGLKYRFRGQFVEQGDNKLMLFELDEPEMIKIMQQEKPDDFVIATGVQHTVRDFTEKAFAANGITLRWEGTGIDEKGYDVATGKMLICVNPQWFRPTDVDNLWGDPTKAKTVLGWNPQSTTYEQLVEIMAKHDRERAKREKALKAVL